jgi:hypothetical protein
VSEAGAMGLLDSCSYMVIATEKNQEFNPSQTEARSSNWELLLLADWIYGLLQKVWLK